MAATAAFRHADGKTDADGPLMCISSPLRHWHIQRSRERANDVVVTVETAPTVRWPFILEAAKNGIVIFAH